jgi:ribose-phosphate pyrophosphokinase
MKHEVLKLGPPVIFATGGDGRLGQAIAARLQAELAEHEERDFVDGEHKIRPLVDVESRDVYVIASLEGDAVHSPNDKLIRTLFFIGALKHAGAGRVTVIAPYLPYARKDRRTKPRDPVNMRNLAALFEAMQTDCMVTLEVHNIAAFENAFRTCRAENLPAAALLADSVASNVGDEPVVVVSPDSGGSKRAELFRSVLETRIDRPVGNALLEKHRSAGEVSGSLFAGDVAGSTAIIIDDLIASGGTVLRAVKRCREEGAAKTIVAVAHGLFTDEAMALFEEGGPDLVLLCDGVAVPEVSHPARLRIVPTAPLFADVIECLHQGGGLYDLIPYS